MKNRNQTTDYVTQFLADKMRMHNAMIQEILPKQAIMEIAADTADKFFGVAENTNTNEDEVEAAIKYIAADEMVVIYRVVMFPSDDDNDNLCVDVQLVPLGKFRPKYFDNVLIAREVTRIHELIIGLYYDGVMYRVNPDYTVNGAKCAGCQCVGDHNLHTIDAKGAEYHDYRVVPMCDKCRGSNA
jgi:hypothetical protein